MMKWIGGVLAALLVGLGLLIWRITPLAGAGSGFTAKTLCSGVFVSGMEPERVFDEEIAPTSDAFSLISYKLDRTNAEVSASLLGLGARKAIYREGLGCSLAIGGPPEPVRAPGRVTPPLALASVEPPQDVADALAAALDNAFTRPINEGPAGTRAVVVMQGGEIIAERYAEGVSAETPLKGWSMNKTLTGLLIGMLVDRGWLELDAPAPVPEWASKGDPRGAITLRDLMTMSSGLDFDESYGDMTSDVVEMLLNERSAAARAAAAPLAHEPGAYWYYSSGTTNILARIAGDVLEAHDLSLPEFMQTELFVPLGVGDATLELDAAGDYVGSSFGYMSTRDWARMGRLFVDEGRAPGGERIVSSDWIKFMTTDNGLSGGQYGAQLWLHRMTPDDDNPPLPGVPADAVFFLGHDGQIVAVIPSRDLVVVRLGETPTWSQAAGGGPLVRAVVEIIDGTPMKEAVVAP